METLGEDEDFRSEDQIKNYEESLLHPALKMRQSDAETNYESTIFEH
jgi:hypothetical protein